MIFRIFIAAKHLIFLSLICLQAGCANRQRTEQISELKVDDAHNDIKSGAPYEINPTSKLILDATSYNFTIPEKVKGKQIKLICIYDLNAFTNNFFKGDSFPIYLMEWKVGQTRYEISKATLTPSGDSPQFYGFKHSQNWHVTINSEFEGDKLLAVWSCNIEVRK